MKITKENIQFIDNYLQQSDVIFVDVRSEITDHIASAVEAKMKEESLDFYDAFKDYMILNKKEILKANNKNFSYFKNANISFSKTLYKPYNLFFIVLLVLFFRYSALYYDKNQILEVIHNALFISTLTIAAVMTIYSFVIIRKRYLCLENLSFVLLAIYYFNLFFNGFLMGDFYGNTFSIGITVFLLYAFIIFSFKTIRKFRYI